MTISEAENFYKQDNKDYDLSNNKGFLKWLKTEIEHGYHCYIDIEELQGLIDNIVTWYEIKYPERELEYYDGRRYYEFKDIEKISDVMNIKQLMFRLPSKQLGLLKCEYRAKGYGFNDEKTEIFMSIYKKDKKDDLDIPYFLVSADSKTGKVEKNYELEDYIDTDKEIDLNELLLIFNQRYRDKLDYSELKDTLNDNYVDGLLRYEILQLAALKMLYSENTIPEHGYERAKRFINEFNKKMNLNLSKKEIDEIMSRDYKNNSDDKKVIVDDYEVKEGKGIKKVLNFLNRNKKSS